MKETFSKVTLFFFRIRTAHIKKIFYVPFVVKEISSSSSAPSSRFPFVPQYPSVCLSVCLSIYLSLIECHTFSSAQPVTRSVPLGSTDGSLALDGPQMLSGTSRAALADPSDRFHRRANGQWGRGEGERESGREPQDKRATRRETGTGRRSLCWAAEQAARRSKAIETRGKVANLRDADEDAWGPLRVGT